MNLRKLFTTAWTVVNGRLLYNNETFLLKGVNFFGLETCDFTLHGLWAHHLTYYLDFLQQHNFNVVRVPFSQQWVLESFETQRPTLVSSEEQGLTSLQILDKFFDQAEKRGIFVLLDMHRLECRAQSHELWYSLDSNKYTAETFFEAWEKVIKRYQHRPNFHGIDLLNEPRGLASWSLNDTSTSWNLFVEYAFQRLDFYDGLVYVEGLDWGRSFKGMPRLNVPQHRVVYSPHVYGPSVVGDVSLNVTKLHADWTSIFGYLIPERSVVIGEFGGLYTGSDKVWQDLLVDYLVGARIPGLFWALNPNSRDTQGLLKDDWSTPETEKLKLLERLQPRPTKVDFFVK